MFDQLLEKLLEEPQYISKYISEAKKFWSTPEFKNWFGNSVVVDKNGEPLVVYTGHFNVTVFGEKYNPKRSLAGGFYTTADPEIASNYATGKADSGEYTTGSQYIFKGKGGKYNKKLYQIELTDKQLQILQQLKTERDEYDGYVHGIGEMDRWIESQKKYDKVARRMSITGGSKNLINIYMFYEQMGYTISGQDMLSGGKTYFDVYKKNDFDVLLDRLGLDWDSADRPRPGVLPLYLSIQKPLVTSEQFPEDLLDALKKKARYEREKDYQGSQWSSEVPLKGWVEEIEKANDYWATRIPKKALPIIKQFGYDGIVDTGGKGGGDKHPVYIVFDSTQVKSVFNKGSFSTTNPKIMEALY